VNRRPEMISPSFSSRFSHPTSAPSGHLLPEEGGSVHASPFPWKGLPSAARRGWLPFWAALGCSRIMAHLRRSPSLSFIPPEPYPARSARHLPHAGKALSVVILFPKYACIRFDDARKPAFSFRSPPHWERLCQGKRYSRFFIHPTQKRPSL